MSPRAVDWIARGDIDAALKNVSLDNLGDPGNATHGFMDFMLMMGIAGGVPADYADHLDLFHTMEAYFTWYPHGTPPTGPHATARPHRAARSRRVRGDDPDE